MMNATRAALAVMAWPALALAGPEGSYTVIGTNPGGQGSYDGSVVVERNGDTYAVLWEVGGVQFLGTGLGAATVKGVPTMGPASEADTAIAVGYVSDGSYGITFYVEQPDGTWKGIWAYGGSETIGDEVWTPR